MIQWLNPYPKQVIGKEEVKAVEAEVHRLLDIEGVRDMTTDMEVKPMLNNQPNERHLFKLRINDDEFKGSFRNGQFDWLHPKPRQKLNEKRVKKVEEQIHEELKSRNDD